MVLPYQEVHLEKYITNSLLNSERYWRDVFRVKDEPHGHLLADTVDVSLDVEAVPYDAEASIVIRNLRKVFQKGLQKKVAAVDGLNLKMYDGQITAFLGHNGAGMLLGSLLL